MEARSRSAATNEVPKQTIERINAMDKPGAGRRIALVSAFIEEAGSINCFNRRIREMFDLSLFCPELWQYWPRLNQREVPKGPSAQ